MGEDEDECSLIELDSEFESASMELAEIVSAGAANVAPDSCATISVEAGFRLRLATAP